MTMLSRLLVFNKQDLLLYEYKLVPGADGLIEFPLALNIDGELHMKFLDGSAGLVARPWKVIWESVEAS